MKETLQLEYYYGKEAEQYTFYRIPKMLFTDIRLKGISIEAKMLYGLMLDRMSLSMKNGWLDKEGRVFIYFTLEDAIALLGYSHTKVIKLFSELDSTKGVGLIDKKKQGQGKPTIIYVKNYSSESRNKTIPKTDNHKTCESATCKTSRNQQSENYREDSLVEQNLTYDKDLKLNDTFLIKEENENNTSSNLEIAETKIYQIEQSETSNDTTNKNKENKKKIQKYKNQKSNILKNGNQDSKNIYTNKTKENKTELSDIPSIHLSSYLDPVVIKKEGEIDGVDLVEIVKEELWKNELLPPAYMGQFKKMEIAIHILTDYQRQRDYYCNAKVCDKDEFQHSVFLLCNEALIEMLTTIHQMNLKGVQVKRKDIYDKVITYVKFQGGECYLEDIMSVAMVDFEKACETRNIKNHLQYMKACIWNALQVGTIGIQAIIKKDFG